VILSYLYNIIKCNTTQHKLFMHLRIYYSLYLTATYAEFTHGGATNAEFTHVESYMLNLLMVEAHMLNSLMVESHVMNVI